MDIAAQAAETSQGSNVVFPLFVVTLALVAFAYVMQRRRERLAEQLGYEISNRKPRNAPRGLVEPPPPPASDIRPRVLDVVIKADEARVVFAAVPPDGSDEIFEELLTNEALEALRERRHVLPMSAVTQVVVVAEHADGTVECARTPLPAPGELPIRSALPSILNLTHIALDPIDVYFERASSLPAVDPEAPSGELEPVLADLRLPRAIDLALRAQGINPRTMTAGVMVTGILGLVGYHVDDGPVPNTYVAGKHSARTYLQADVPRTGVANQLDADEMTRFAFEFQMSKCDRGLFVTGRFGSMDIYERERREPRIRFLTRDRLQVFLDGMGLG